MFDSLPLKPTYSTYEDDVGEVFYSPILQESVSYDRAAAYFSARSLAHYSKGLEYFAKQGRKCRIIVSTELSREDFDAIQTGYVERKRISATLIPQLREQLSLDEEQCLSNLAHLIALKVIDLKIAFTAKGIFHDKFGLAVDAAGNIVCFRGSNNETEAALQSNYEAFDITCSWLASDFDYKKILKSQETFEQLWNNQKANIFVCDADQVILDELATHDKGKIIYDPVQLETNCIVLDYNERLYADIRMDASVILSGAFYKLRLKRYVDAVVGSSQTILFNEALGYPEFKKIIALFETDAAKRGYRFLTTKRLLKYIQLRELYIDKRAKVGLSIKRQEPEVLAQYQAYKTVVDSAMVRLLRDKQMWDSFFMCTMKKSGNFSVPGSGKTASVLGVFAYLSEKQNVRKIVMVGPKNAFGSWRDEFKNCFGSKKTLQVFDIHDPKFKSNQARKQALLLDSGKCNLFLLNYECLGTYLDEIKKIIGNDTLLVFDEVHKVKAVGGFRASHALEISRFSNHTIALTGTPIPNSYLDIRNFLDILYHEDYADFFGFSEQQLRSPTETDIKAINDKLQPFFCRTTKQQLQVPEADPDSVFTVSASDEENALFNILVQKYANNKLALVIRLLQLETNPKLLLNTLDLSDFADILDTSGEVEDIDYADYSQDVDVLIKSIDRTSKFESCIDIAKKLHQESKPMIVWCIFVDSIRRIVETLSSCGIKAAGIFGETSMEDRDAYLDAFRSGKIDVLVTNPHTLAESVSLHSICHDAIYYEYSYNLVHLLQSKDRIHRLGLPANQYTHYHFLQTEFLSTEDGPYSLDECIYLRLKEKEQIMLDAIDADVLEQASTPQEDLDLIFAGLGL